MTTPVDSPSSEGTSGTGSRPQRAIFRFYEELNDFLPSAWRKTDIERRFPYPAAVKDFIEGLGVPHTEVDLVLINGVSVDFGHPVRDGDRVSVYPKFESLDIGSLTRLRPAPLREIRFVVDVNLGRLAGYLRMTGFDTSYRNDADDASLVAISHREHRILLTRDRQLLKHGDVSHGYYVRHRHPAQQLREILRRFDLCNSLDPFSRCLRCNRRLKPAAKSTVQDRIPPRTRRCYDRFWRCTGCHRIYWEGSHYRRMRALIDEVCR